MKWVVPVLLAASMLSALTPGADADCSQGLCSDINREAIICDNRQPGSPCGTDQAADFVLTCGDIHDQITAGQLTPCAQKASEYSEAHPQCCGDYVAPSGLAPPGWPPPPPPPPPPFTGERCPNYLSFVQSCGESCSPSPEDISTICEEWRTNKECYQSTEEHPEHFLGLKLECGGEVSSEVGPACARGLCSGLPVNRDAIICDNKKPGSPCGADQADDFVLRCGDIHDQITAGQRTPCAQAASEYSEAHPHCCVVVGTASRTASLSAIGACASFLFLVAMVIDV